MPGPWEKYQSAPADTPQDGPWAKYGKQPSADIPTMTVTAPRETTFDRINDFGNDLGDSVAHHLGSIPVGVAQLASHIANFVGGGGVQGQIGRQLASNAGVKLEPSIGDKVTSAIDNYASSREKSYQDKVPDSAGSYLGAAVGEVLPWLTGAGEARAAGLLPKAATRLGKLGLSATEGAVIGSTQPVTSGDFSGDKIKQAISGALASPIAEGVTAGGSKLGSVIASALKGGDKLNLTDRAAADILTREAENPAALTKAAPSAIPGVTRTLSEETLDPGIARLERNLRSTNKQFDALDRSNNAARVSSLEKIAGSDADMAAALDARDTTTGALLDAAFQEGAGFDAAQAAQQAADRGAHAARVREIEKANERRRALGYATQLPVPGAPTAAYPKEALQSRIGEVIAKNNGNPAVQTALAVVGGALKQADDSVPGLYNVRKYVGDLLSGRAGGDTVSAKAASRELIDIRDAIDEELQRRAPTFSKYLTAYQDASKPINRMDIGRDFLQGSSGSAILDPVTGSQVLTPAQFSKKARDLDAVAARATGFAKAKATDILTPQDIVTIKAIQDDLERQSFRATAGSGGNSQTFERQAMQDRLARGAGREALRHVPVVGRYAGDFLDMLDKSRNERVKERLAYLVANPEEARRVLAALPPKGQQIVSNALEGLGAPVARIASADRQGQGGQ